jgi:hypothetical protein
MTLEARENQENTLLKWEKLRLRFKGVKAAHEKFVKQIPGYKKDSIYQHFYINETLDVDILLNRSTISPAEAYRQCLELLTQIERYHRLFELNPIFAKRECSQVPKKHLNKLKSYLDQAEAELNVKDRL